MSARIVVADDSLDIRTLIGFTLRRRGYTVLETDAGDAALDLIRREQPDLALLDVMMPGLNGLEVAQRLTADPATAAIPIIMLSAKGQLTEIEAGMATGAVAYLVKPFIPKEMAARVAEVLASHRPGAAE